MATRVINPFLEFTSNDSIGFGTESAIWRGPTGFADASGNGNSGTYVADFNVVSDTGSGGVSAFDPDGTGDRMSVPLIVSGFGAPFSYGGWVKTTASVINDYIWGQGRAGSTVEIIGFSISSGKARCTARDSANQLNIYTAATAINDGAWHLVAVTVNASGQPALYVDGTFLSRATSQSLGAVTFDQASVGDFANTDLNNFDGRLDDIRIDTSGEWSASQISDWWNGGRGYNA